jgi:hypothetical protein
MSFNILDDKDLNNSDTLISHKKSHPKKPKKKHLKEK